MMKIKARVGVKKMPGENGWGHKYEPSDRDIEIPRNIEDLFMILAMTYDWGQEVVPSENTREHREFLMSNIPEYIITRIWNKFPVLLSNRIVSGIKYLRLNSYIGIELRYPKSILVKAETVSSESYDGLVGRYTTETFVPEHWKDVSFSKLFSFKDGEITSYKVILENREKICKKLEEQLEGVVREYQEKNKEELTAEANRNWGTFSLISAKERIARMMKIGDYGYPPMEHEVPIEDNLKRAKELLKTLAPEDIVRIEYLYHYAI